ncbi:MAG: hypothetical protein EXS13_07525 [Planctomycetes bacterium]|nr:hypothetical protein [Planctomycetota bacterium]
MARRALTARAIGGAALAALCAAASCGAEDSTAGVNQVTRLADSGRVTVQTPWRAPDAEIERGLMPSFVRGFEQDLECDGVITPIRSIDGVASPEVKADALAAARGKAGMRFQSQNGALLWWLPVRPETPYVAKVRARRPAAGAGTCAPRAGELTIVEFFQPQQGRLADGKTLAELDSQLGKPIAEHRVAPPEDGSYGDLRVRFTTSGRTSSVLVMLFGGAPADIAGATPTIASRTDGPIDFDDLALFELPLARVLPTLAADARQSGSEWEREVTIGGETRVAWIAPPPSEIRLPVTLPTGRYRLTFGYGVAEESRPAAGRVEVRVSARLETADSTTPIALPQRAVAPRERLESAGWHDATFDGVGSGEPATFVIAAESASSRPTEDLFAVSLPLLVPDARPAGAPRNVVLISIDTLRPDRLGAYGARRDDGNQQSPAIDALARDAVVFEEARAQSPYTLPSHASLLTGLHPTVHGIERFDSTLAATACVRLIDRFREGGYVSAAFTGGGFLSPVYGLWRGFDRWSTLDPFLHEQEPMRQMMPRPGETALNAAFWRRSGLPALREWLVANRSAPFFLFLHTYAVHNYRPPADLCERFKVSREPGKFDPLADSDERTPTAEQLPDLRNRYDASVAAVDREVGHFLALLSELGLDRDTIVVLLSDHGEELGEHGGFGHGRTLYDEVLRVPLIVRAPGLAPRRDKTPVALADVAPSLLELCGLPGLPGATGRTLLPVPAEATAPFSAEVSEPHLGELRALETGGFKLIQMTRYSPIRPRLPLLALYALPLDPRERQNLLALDLHGTPRPDAEQPQEAIALRRAFEAHFRELERTRLPASSIPGGLRSPDLDQLGY